MKKIYHNLLNSLSGIKEGLKENSFLLEIFGGVILMLYLSFSNFDQKLKLVIFPSYIILLAFELLNTAIEKLSDKITKKIDPDIKKIKDLSSASVFLILILIIILLIISLIY